MSAVLPAPTPDISIEARPFWDAAREGRLMLQRCAACGVVIWYPRALCPKCSSVRLEWFAATGRGTVYSYTINHRGDGPYREATPYVLAYVELAEGPRVLTNIVDCDPASVRIGDAVRAVFHPTADGATALLRFRPS